MVPDVPPSRHWEVVEDYGPGEKPQVAARFSDRERADRWALFARLASRPVEPGDEWGPDYYVREADRAAS